MFYNELEIQTLKKEIFFTNEEILKKLEEIIKDKNSDYNVLSLKNEYERLKETPLEDIKEDFSKKKFLGYCIDYYSGNVQKAVCEDLYFVYDNKNHELYLSSFMWT